MILSIFLLYALFISLSKQEDYKLKVINGSWNVVSATNCIGNLNISAGTIIKMKETNPTTSEAYLNYFLPNNTEIFGKCNAQYTSIDSGLITTNFSCDSTNTLFQDIQNNVIAQWDAYDGMSMILNVTQLSYASSSMSSSSVNNSKPSLQYCSILATNITIYWETNVWNVTSCSCYPCCYQLNTPFTITNIPDITNFPGINMTGTVLGPFCDATMVMNDQCALNSTTLNSDTDPNENITSMHCTYCGNRHTTTLTFYNGSVMLDWGGCHMQADPPIITSNWGNYLKSYILIISLMFVALIIMA